MLPAGGWDGDVPDLPLPRPTKRERELWAWAWRTPQAAAWVREPWRWQTVATWVRMSVRAESRSAPAAVINAQVRLADQIGLTPAGLRFNGWAISRDELGERREEQTPASTPAVASARERLRVADGGKA